MPRGARELDCRRARRRCGQEREVGIPAALPESSHRWALGSEMEDDQDRRRQHALDAYIAATFRWRIAIEKAEGGDTSAIIELLNSGEVFPPESQSLLADLLNRRRLTKKRGGQRRPSYESSREESELSKAASLVRERRGKGERFETALAEVARERNIDTGKLRNFIRGKGSRRSRRRRG